MSSMKTFNYIGENVSNYKGGWGCLSARINWKSQWFVLRIWESALVSTVSIAHTGERFWCGVVAGWPKIKKMFFWELPEKSVDENIRKSENYPKMNIYSSRFWHFSTEALFTSSRVNQLFPATNTHSKHTSVCVIATVYIVFDSKILKTDRSYFQLVPTSKRPRPPL